MVAPLVLYRIGSDPEHIFARIEEGEVTLVSAQEVFGENKTHTVQSYLGTDAHPSTAELRPPAAHHIRRHLYDIGFGLCAAQDFLVKRPKRFERVVLVAKPHVAGECLGAHLHASFFVHCATQRALEVANLVWRKSGSWTTRDPSRNTSKLPPNINIDALPQAFACGEVLAPYWWGQAMNYLLVPFENWVQPWFARLRRNGQYGDHIHTDVVRSGVSPRPMLGPKWNDWAYCHWEYRMPSTWLVHPYLAYAYLALFKFSLLNFATIWERAVVEDKILGEPKTKGVPLRPTDVAVTPDEGETYHAVRPQGAYFYELFKSRWRAINEAPVHMSKDLAELVPAIQACERMKDEWNDPLKTIDIEAWRQSLG